jgi:hypothetical protein
MARALAVAAKDKGNAALSAGNFEEAIAAYTEVCGGAALLRARRRRAARLPPPATSDVAYVARRFSAALCRAAAAATPPHPRLSLCGLLLVACERGVGPAQRMWLWGAAYVAVRPRCVVSCWQGCLGVPLLADGRNNGAHLRCCCCRRSATIRPTTSSSATGALVARWHDICAQLGDASPAVAVAAARTSTPHCVPSPLVALLTRCRRAQVRGFPL